MTKQTINIGASANDRTGDSLRAAFNKVNENFSELYTALGLDSDGLNLGAFEFTGSTITTTDSSSITIDQAVTVTSNLTVGGDILPETANGGNLGSASKPWKSLYVSSNTIYIGSNALGLDEQGELVWNGSRVAHADGEFIRLDSLTDVNANSPNAGDTIAWMGSHYVNVPLNEDRLSHNGDEVVLVGGANPYVTFPAITGGDQLQIQGAEVSSVSGSLALTSQGNLNIISNGSGTAPGGSKNWTFGDDGNLTIPGGILSIDHFSLDADYDSGYSVYIGNNHPTAGTLGGVVIGDTRGGFVEIVTNKLIIGQTSVPTHSYGAPGDIAGQVAFDNDYIYYCKQNYVNNSTDIWVRVGWTSSNW